MLTVDEARARLREITGVLPAEMVDLAAAAGLVLAQDVVAGRDLPGFDNSAMDGFAVRVADLAGASRGRPARLRLQGEAAAGSIYPGVVKEGGAVSIMTGAAIPAGAEAVLEVEETEINGADVLAFREVEPGRSFRAAGSDIAQGEVALRAGTFVGAAQVALLAALGVARPTCVRRPRVAVLATGNELVDVETEPGPGQVVDVVGPALRAAISAAGAEASLVERVGDDVEHLRWALLRAAEHDLVVSVGGVSMGEHDLVRPLVEELGELDFWKVKMRPGKPLAVGAIQGRPFIGLPGNPVAALVGFEVFVLPTIMSMSGRAGWRRPERWVALGSPLRTPLGLRTFARARLLPRGQDAVDGGDPGTDDVAGGRSASGGDRPRPVAEPLPGQGSYQIRWLGQANALLDIAEDTGELSAGKTVRAILIDHAPGPPE